MSDKGRRKKNKRKIKKQQGTFGNTGKSENTKGSLKDEKKKPVSK